MFDSIIRMLCNFNDLIKYIFFNLCFVLKMSLRVGRSKPNETFKSKGKDESLYYYYIISGQISLLL